MEQVPFSRIMIVHMEVDPFSQNMVLIDAFSNVILLLMTFVYDP